MKSAYFPLAGLALCQAAPLSAKKPDDAGEKILAGFAECASRAAPGKTQAVMDSVPDSDDERRQLDLLVKQQAKCVKFGPSLKQQQLASEVNLGVISLSQAVSQFQEPQRQIVFPIRALRGAIAQQLYLDLPKPEAALLPTSEKLGDQGAVIPVGYAVVRCAVARDPRSADRLVRSSRFSSGEAEAGRAFAPALNACARGKGKVDISGTAIHGWAAEALYKQRRFGALEGR